MTDSLRLYDIIYALAASDGREAALFGNCAPRAREALVRSLAGRAFPELWFEVPLLGEPWFDFHALTSSTDIEPDDTLTSENTGGHPEAFKWFAAQERGVRQLALSWDTGSGNPSSPAIQLLLSTFDPDLTYGFLEAAGKPDAIPAYRAFISRLPKGWFPCYCGVFPSRPGHFLRVECIPQSSLQHAYAQDADLLRAHLQQVGVNNLDSSIVTRCNLLAQAPFELEFQFDVDEDGFPAPTFSASSRFSAPPGTPDHHSFDPNGAAGIMMRQLEKWGLVDERWRLLTDTAFSKKVEKDGELNRVYCYPAFIKLRWKDGKPYDVKSYIIAGCQV